MGNHLHDYTGREKTSAWFAAPRERGLPLFLLGTMEQGIWNKIVKVRVIVRKSIKVKVIV